MVEFRRLFATLAVFATAGCGINYHVRPEGAAAPAASWPPTKTAPPIAASSLTGPVLDGNGVCQGAIPVAAQAIAPGVGECDLVRLKGKPPTDVLVGESGKGGREVQVLYAEPGGKELYFFVDNRLDRVVK